MDNFVKKIKEDVVLPDLDSNVDLLNVVNNGYGEDYYEAYHIYDQGRKITESVLKDIAEVIRDSYNHFVNDLGRTPSVDEVFEDIRDNYEGYSDIDDSPEKTSEWYDLISAELSRQDLNAQDEEVFEEALKFLEENEDEVECAVCGELVRKALCTKNKNGRYVCDVCSVTTLDESKEEPKQKFFVVCDFDGEIISFGVAYGVDYEKTMCDYFRDTGLVNDSKYFGEDGEFDWDKLTRYIYEVSEDVELPKTEEEVKQFIADNADNTEEF